MPIPYKHTRDEPAVSYLEGHLRRRSSISQLTPPFVTHLAYDDRTGEISLPSSPPLLSWQEKESPPIVTYYDDDKKARLPPYSWPAARGTTRMSRPWLGVLGLGCVTFALVLVLFWVKPIATSYTLLSRISFKSSPCDPFSAPGSLTVDISDPDRNQWIPSAPTCTSPALLAQLRAEPLVSDFSWLHNKTALIIGDSISREHVEGFCRLMGHESEVVRKNHAYSPAPVAARPAAKVGHAMEKPARLEGRGYRQGQDASLPRICYLPEHDFMLVSVYHFGLDQEDYWRGSRMPQYASPGMFEHRFADLVMPLVKKLRAAGRVSAPDLVEVSTGAWDLARWAEQDIAEGKNPAARLSTERSTWFRFRVGQILERIQNAFPDAQVKMFRTQHFPADQVAEHDYFMDKISSGRRNREEPPQPVLFSHERIGQMNQAVRSLVLPNKSNGTSTTAPYPEFRVNEWGRILKGHEAHQRDRLHGEPLPGGYVWGDIMLYELWRSTPTP